MGNGTIHRLGPGDVHMAQDLTGHGHTTCVVGQVPRVTPRSTWRGEGNTAGVAQMFACALLGVAQVRMLGYRDSGMPGTPANQHWDAFAQAAPGEAVGRLVRIIRGLRPRVIVTEPPGGSYAPRIT